MRLHDSNFGIRFLIVELKFSLHSFFKTRVLFKIFDTEFPYKRSFFRATLPSRQNGGGNCDKVYNFSDLVIYSKQNQRVTKLLLLEHLSSITMLIQRNRSYPVHTVNRAIMSFYW